MGHPRIACVIDTIGKGGGAEQLVATLVPRLAALGAQVEVIAIHDWPINHAAALRDAGIVVHELHTPHGHALRGLPAMARLARAQRYDVYWGHLVTGNMFARWGAKLSGGRAVATLHSEGYARNPPTSLRARVAVGAEGVLLGGAAHVAVSRAVADDFARYFGWRDIAVAYNGVDVDALRALAATQPRAAARAAFGYTPDDILLVTPARYVPKKGQIDLLHAVARLRETRGLALKLLLCGEGAAASPLHGAVTTLGLGDCVTIHDVIDQPDLIPLIAAADLFVLPSLREPFGIAAAEAMAIGTPALLTDVDGFKELVGDDAGAMLVPPGNPDALAVAIEHLLEDSTGTAAMAARGQQRVDRHFSIAACAQRWMTLLDAVHHDGRR